MGCGQQQSILELQRNRCLGCWRWGAHLRGRKLLPKRLSTPNPGERRSLYSGSILTWGNNTRSYDPLPSQQSVGSFVLSVEHFRIALGEFFYGETSIGIQPHIVRHIKESPSHRHPIRYFKWHRDLSRNATTSRCVYVMFLCNPQPATNDLISAGLLTLHLQSSNSHRQGNCNCYSGQRPCRVCWWFVRNPYDLVCTEINDPYAPGQLSYSFGSEPSKLQKRIGSISVELCNIELRFWLPFFPFPRRRAPTSCLSPAWAVGSSRTIFIITCYH